MYDMSHTLILLSFLDYLAVSMVAPQIGLRIREMGASQLFVGLISSSYGAIQLFSSTLHGMACDAYGRRSTLLLCCVVISSSYFLLGITASYIGMLFIRCLIGLVKHTQSNFKIIGGDLNTGAERSVFISKINSVSGVAFMIGPLIAASLFQPHNSFQWSAITCSCIFFLISLLSFYLVRETLPSEVEKKEDEETKLSTLQRFIKHRNLWTVFLYRFCAASSVIILRYFTPLYTQHYFGFTARHAGYMTSFVGFSGVVASSSAGVVARLVPDNNSLLKYLSLVLVVAIAATVLSTSMPALLATQFLLSLATQNLRIVVDALILASANQHDRGEVFGLGASIVGLCRVGGPLVAGALAEYHMMLPLLVSLLLAVLGAAALFLSPRPHDDGSLKQKIS